jgi:hypothetical protein
MSLFSDPYGQGANAPKPVTVPVWRNGQIVHETPNGPAPQKGTYDHFVTKELSPEDQLRLDAATKALQGIPEGAKVKWIEAPKDAGPDKTPEALSPSQYAAEAARVQAMTPEQLQAEFDRRVAAKVTAPMAAPRTEAENAWQAFERNTQPGGAMSRMTAREKVEYAAFLTSRYGDRPADPTVEDVLVAQVEARYPDAYISEDMDTLIGQTLEGISADQVAPRTQAVIEALGREELPPGMHGAHDPAQRIAAGAAKHQEMVKAARELLDDSREGQMVAQRIGADLPSLKYLYRVALQQRSLRAALAGARR